MDKLNVGVEFSCLSELLNAKKEYEEATNTVLCVNDSLLLKGDGDLVARMRYSRVEFACKAGKERKSQSKGLRDVSTYKKNCKVKIRIVLKEDKLVVNSAYLVHEQHLTDLQTFLHYPENMKLTKEEDDIAKTMIAGDSKKQKIKSHLTKIRSANGIASTIALKSIHNVQTRVRLSKEHIGANENELEKLLENMLAVPGASVRVVKENNELIAIYFQDSRMKAMFEVYPEVLLYDATYKMNARNMPLFIQSIVDGNGETEIVSIWICKSESTIVAETMVKMFQECNPSWEKIVCVIGDKDFADRHVYRDLLPNAALQICLFHVLQTFNREITTLKRNITQTQRLEALEILQRLCYAQSEQYYDEQYLQLSNLGLEHVMDYFDTNWHSIRLEWTMFGRNKFANYMNHTNNRSESQNQKLKMIGSRNSTLLTFFENVSTSIAVLASEKNIKAVRSNMKTVRRRFEDATLTSFQEFVTPFIFKKIHAEYENSLKVVFELCNDNKAVTTYGTTVTTTKCECTFFKSMNLPCKHIFAFCKENDLNTFLPHLCAVRWTKHYYNKSHPALQLDGNVPVSAPIYIQTVRSPLEKDKYKSVSVVTKELNSLMSTLPPDRFAYCMDQLKNLKDAVIDPDVGNIDENEHVTMEEEGETDNVAMNEHDDQTNQSTNVAVEVQEQQQGQPQQVSVNAVQAAQNGWNLINGWPFFGTLPNGGYSFPNATQMFTNSSQIMSQTVPNSTFPFAPSSIIQFPSFQPPNQSQSNASEGPQSQLSIVKANHHQLKKINLPVKVKTVGRPKGAVNTVIGTKKSENREKRIPVLRLKIQPSGQVTKMQTTKTAKIVKRK